MQMERARSKVKPNRRLLAQLWPGFNLVCKWPECGLQVAWYGAYAGIVGSWPTGWMGCNYTGGCWEHYRNSPKPQIRERTPHSSWSQKAKGTLSRSARKLLLENVFVAYTWNADFGVNSDWSYVCCNSDIVLITAFHPSNPPPHIYPSIHLSIHPSIHPFISHQQHTYYISYFSTRPRPFDFIFR